MNNSNKALLFSLEDHISPPLLLLKEELKEHNLGTIPQMILRSPRILITFKTHEFDADRMTNFTTENIGTV